MQLADISGPMSLSLWGGLAEHFLKLMTEESQRNSKKLFLMVEGVRVSDVSANDYNGHILTTMRVLHSVGERPAQRATVLTMSSTPQSPYLQPQYEYKIPEHPQCIRSFLPKKAQFAPPFRATLRGVVLDVEVGGTTQLGQAKTVFVLVDEAGTWLRCCAVGRNAVSSALKNGNEIIVYFGAGRAARASGLGCIWLFKDSSVVLIGKKAGVKRLEIELK